MIKQVFFFLVMFTAISQTIADIRLESTDDWRSSEYRRSESNDVQIVRNTGEGSGGEFHFDTLFINKGATNCKALSSEGLSLISGQSIWNPGSITFHTDFETIQWSADGTLSNGNWETANDTEVRTTIDARLGNQAIWLGDFNGDDTRNEIAINRGANWSEHWIGFAIKVTEALPPNRTWIQFRNTRGSGGVGPGVINPVTLRQASTPGQLYWATSTDESNVDTIYTTGASQGTESTFFNYNLNEWIDIVIHWVLDPVDGYLEIWVNGEKVVDETGTTTYRYAHVDGEPYDGDVGIQMGPYWSSTNIPQGDAFFDEYKMWKGAGGSYESVSPGGLSPNGNQPNDTETKNKNALFGTLN